ncbi:hypothetical protein MTX78_21585 [Hymenobacter tibetensis]|uniref:Prolyl-tRNA synthetase n=1 Tax=Hymenobacter tibetensis TaxID=497967 RepID=A0ABY4CY81_9BACT|nr:hypothetical protein [Hymenobacter tibetensis]UOG74697.1 hypothetical protein MTX78_21585 [Hymenobacter tibetensis]
MKNFLPSLLPALALLTLGGCAGTSALTTTESDGVYYSSKDRTTQNARAAVATTAPAEVQSDDEISNPDYTAEGQRSSSTVTESTEYYDDDYAYSSRIRRFHQPYYRGFGYGYNDFVYNDPFWYGGSSYYGSGFYDPFYGPAYGYGGLGGSFVNINIGFGNPWGWGYNPWRYGRGYGLYDSYYGGGYGGYGYNNYYNINNYYGGGVGTVRNVRYGARTSRSGEAGTAGRTGTSIGTGNVTGSRSRGALGGVAEPTGGRAATGGLTESTTLPSNGRGRSRTIQGGTANEGNPGVISQQPTDEGQRGYRTAVDNAGNNIPQPSSYGTRSRQRVAERIGAGTDAAAQPQYSQPRRSRFSELNTNQSGGGQTADQPTRRQRTYETPQSSESPQRAYTPQRTYEAPQRTYEAPQRSYESPSRSSSPSMGGGGNSGGGDGGGGGRGRGRN